MEKMKFFSPETDEEKQRIIKELTSKSAAFGIDLGTTNSAIAVIPRGTAPIIIPLRNGKTTIPSCVMWDSMTDSFIVGKEAYNQRYKANCIYSVKRMMQDPSASVVLRDGSNEKIMTPAEVSAEILKGLIAETGGVYGDIKDVVITVPAKFNEIGRTNTKKAVELAGLNVLGIIAEPTAASMCYQLAPKDGGSRDLLVYDLGGGTFDISLVRISGGHDYSDLEDIYEIQKELRKPITETTIRALDSDGDTVLGGDDIDNQIYENFLEELSDRGITADDISVEERNSIILLIEQMKKGNPYDMTQITFCTKDGREEKVVLSYEQFKAGLLPVYRRTLKLVNNVLQKNRTNADAIVLVGGSTKNPILKELLQEDFPGYEINDAFPQDEAVALGAGVHARFLKFGDNNIVVFDSLADGIGVRTGVKMETIISSGCQFPVTKSKLFVTSEDNQKEIEVDIMQGNVAMAVEACKLGTLLVDGLPAGKQGDVEIKIQLSIDVRGLLKCSVTVYNVNDYEHKITRDLELKISAGNVPTSGTSLTAIEKNKIRWRSMLASSSGVKELILTHFSPSIPKPSVYLNELRYTFGHTTIGFDGLTRELTFGDD